MKQTEIGNELVTTAILAILLIIAVLLIANLIGAINVFG